MISGGVWADCAAVLGALLAGACSARWSAGYAQAYSARLGRKLGVPVPAAGPAQASGRAPFRSGGSAAMGLLACIAQGHYGYALGFWVTLAALNMLLILAMIDVRLGLLPDAFTLPLLWLGLAAAWMGATIALRDAVAGAMAGYVFLWLLYWAYAWLGRGEAMGYGDFKLLAALGAWVGVASLPYVLLAACVGGVLWAFCRQKNLRLDASYPFGPFLAASGAAALALRPEVQSYFW